jgi:hypothetical protein
MMHKGALVISTVEQHEMVRERVGIIWNLRANIWGGRGLNILWTGCDWRIGRLLWELYSRSKSSTTSPTTPQ